MASCVTCPSTPLPPCACGPEEECIRINQSCEECARNVCQPLATAGGKKRDIGPTIGGAIGGLLAGAVAVVLLWFFYRKAVSSGKRPPWKGAFGKHSRTHSRRMSANEKGEPTPAPHRASQAVSRPLDISTTGSKLSRRLSTPPEEDEDAAMATGENPFGDQHSVGTRQSFQTNSSHSTRIIPIVYVPSDSASMSVEDGQARTPLGERRNTQQHMAPPLMESDVQLARKPSKTKPKAKPAPIRPTRRASLDLVLPPASPSNLPLPASPPVGGPTPTDSRFSSSTWATSYNGPRDSNALSAPGARAGGSRALSTMSSASGASSHLSYILDPPQLVTPRSAERVAFAGQSQAHRVQLSHPNTPLPRPSTAPTPTTPAFGATKAEDPFSDAAEAQGESEVISSRVAGPLAKAMAAGGNGRPSTAPTHLSMAPQSARNSDISTEFSIARASVAPSESGISTRIHSTASFSALDGIPFLSSGASTPLTGEAPPLPLLPPRAPFAAESRPTSGASLARSSAAWTQGPQSMIIDTRPSSTASTQGLTSTISTWGPGLRPDSTATDASGLPERRSGFASVLNDVPFHLAFPGDRDSVATERLSRFDGRTSVVSEAPPPVPTMPPAAVVTEPAVVVQAASPRVGGEEFDGGKKKGEEVPRASTSSFADAARVAAAFADDEV